MSDFLVIATGDGRSHSVSTDLARLRVPSVLTDLSWQLERGPSDAAPCRLCQKRNAEKKLAVTVFSFPPDKGNVGTAAYLNVFGSIFKVLTNLKREGYDVGELPNDAEELIKTVRPPVRYRWKPLLLSDSSVVTSVPGLWFTHCFPANQCGMAWIWTPIRYSQFRKKSLESCLLRPCDW